MALGEMTHIDKGTNPIDFGSDLADSRIGISSEIRITIPD